MSFEWFSFLETEKKRKEMNQTDTHIRFGYIEPWSTVLKTQRTSLRIYTKLSVLVGKPWVLLKTLENLTTDILFYSEKNPI